MPPKAPPSPLQLISLDSPLEWTFEFDPQQETFKIKVDKAVVTPKKATIFSKMKKTLLAFPLRSASGSRQQSPPIGASKALELGTKTYRAVLVVGPEWESNKTLLSLL